MARSIISVPQFPDVPLLPGVPQLRRSPTAQQLRVLAIATAAINGRLWQSSLNAPKWGIYNSANQLVVTPDNITTFDSRNEYRVSDFPVQAGAFASYNKVASPYEVALRLTKSSDLEGRAKFLQQIDAAARSLELLYILTPERGYQNVNITRYEVTRRGPSGAYFLTEVDIFFREIRQVQAQYSTSTAITANAKEPNALPSVAGGVVQPQPVPVTVDGAGAFE